MHVMLPSIHHLLDKEIVNNQSKQSSSTSDLPSTPMLTISHSTKIEELKSGAFVALNDTNKTPNSRHASSPKYNSEQLESVKKEDLPHSMTTDNIATTQTSQGMQPTKSLNVTSGYLSEYSDLGDSAKKRRRPISPQASISSSHYGEVEIKREPDAFEDQIASSWKTGPSTSQPIASTHRSQQRTSTVSPSSPSASPSPNSTTTTASIPLTSDAVVSVIKGTATASLQDTRSRFTSNQITSRTTTRLDYKEGSMDQYMVPTDLSDRSNPRHNDTYSPTRGGLVQSISRNQERPVMSFRNLPHSTKQRSAELMIKRRSIEADPELGEDYNDGWRNENQNHPLNLSTRLSSTSAHGSKFNARTIYREENSLLDRPEMQHEGYYREDISTIHPSHRHHPSRPLPSQSKHSPPHEFAHELDQRYTHRSLSKVSEYLTYPSQEQDIELSHQIYRRRYSGELSSNSMRNRHGYILDHDQLIRQNRRSPPELGHPYRPLRPKSQLSDTDLSQSQAFEVPHNQARNLRHDTRSQISSHQQPSPARLQVESKQYYSVYSTYRDYQAKRAEPQNVINLVDDYNEEYEHSGSNRVSGSEGTIQHARTSALQWRDSYHGIRHSVSESDLHSVETNRRLNSRSHKTIDDDLGMPDSREAVSEVEYEGDQGFSGYEKVKATSTQRMAYEEIYNSRLPRDAQAQPESRRPMFMNQREPHPYDAQTFQYHQYHPSHPSHPSHTYSHSSSHEQYPPSHTPGNHHNAQQPSPPFHHSSPHQHQQHPTSDNHHTPASSLMDQNSSQPPKTPGPNRRGPYLSRQRAIMAGLEPSTSSSRYQCQYCQKRFSRPSSLRIHTYSHTGERPFKCSEEGCGRQFSVQSNMRRHLRVHRLGRMRSDYLAPQDSD